MESAGKGCVLSYEVGTKYVIEKSICTFIGKSADGTAFWFETPAGSAVYCYRADHPEHREPRRIPVDLVVKLLEHTVQITTPNCIYPKDFENHKLVGMKKYRLVGELVEVLEGE